MVKLTKLKEEEVLGFRKLLLQIFAESFSTYPPKAQEYNQNYWDEKRLKEYVFRKNRLLLLAKDGRKFIGYLIGKYYSSGKSSILWLGVLKSHQRLGIGSCLVGVWGKWARAKGVRTLRASTANFENEKFYTKLGFTKLPAFERNDWGMKKLVFLKRI